MDIKFLCPKTCETGNVQECIDMYRTKKPELYMYNSKKKQSYTCIILFFSSYTCITLFFFELYMYNSGFFCPIHFDTFLYIVHFSYSVTFLLPTRYHFSGIAGLIFQVQCNCLQPRHSNLCRPNLEQRNSHGYSI